MQVYEKELELNLSDLPVEGTVFNQDSLSEEEKQKAKIVGEIIEEFAKKHSQKDFDYGEEFDRFFDKSLTELRILQGMFKM